MLDSIDDRRVKNFINRNNPDPYFPKWQDLPWSQQIIFILKEIVNENSELKKQIRDLKGEMIPVEEEPTGEEPEEPEDIEEVTDEIFELPPLESSVEEVEEPKLEKQITEEEKIPVEISEFPCPECDKKFPNKGLLKAHVKKHGEKNE